jgi:hypothetical protein
VSAEVKRLDIEQVQSLVADEHPASRLRTDAVTGFEHQLRRLLLRTMVLSALVGAVVAAVVPGRRWTDLPLGAVGGVLGVAALLGWAWRGYEPAAFEERPRFEGALEQAPELLGTIQRHVGDVEVVRSRIGILGARIAELYTATAATEEDTTEVGTSILHVSDVHSNPLGIEVVDRLVENFHVDAVLDTGDLTTFGNPLEARIGELLGTIGVPYLFVPGNHDSPPPTGPPSAPCRACGCWTGS